MANRVSFSGEELTLDEIAFHHTNVESALLEFFSGHSEAFLNRFAQSTPDEVREALKSSLAELDYTSSMSVISAIEAAVRMDYFSRVYSRGRDPLSRAMRGVHRIKGNRASLEDDLIPQWREHSTVPSVLLSHAVSAFSFRHWIAHGRYWKPKLGAKYDYLTVFVIAEELFVAMDKNDADCQAE
ncbi:hypothetical protein Bsp3421_003101 [Burkholderia sp. FERM BP-3421]|uniref:hypothetical protein n=1 Tax=Burkholderia sp. FERM BP-3421 TaxID=1494466 RepID=UPI00235F90B7|nr:hypothetical protein [Burkholderia sp. FERM BP-3421]WDD93055.1 hypothetical protein Bsp3421_003101 [Burkholderia sp. FERM BP-3421]